jgi:hypothetical protein
MKAWKLHSPYVFAAYYIASPCHENAGWMGKRASLAAIGWKLLPVYVGQQVAGCSPCAKSVLTSAQGETDGSDAVAKIAAEGFGAGTHIYLDVERCDVLPQAMKDYAAAWIEKITAAGFGAGLYCHKHNAADLRAVAPASRFWIAGGVTSQFSLATSKPSDSGIAFADVWQRPAPVSRTFGGVKILVDEDVSATADPAGAIPT